MGKDKGASRVARTLEWLNVQKVFKIMNPAQNPIILVSKVSPSEK